MPDNRYYYFKDAKGNRHTVNKAAFDNDREGFAKAFPGARMEVIDRKTGRRGDVDVKDAGRVGDFGAHLFTGQTVRREKYQPKTSLGKAAHRVAQEKWGGYGGAVTPMQNDSELVRGLKNADAAQRLQAPVSYTKPGAVKQMVKQTRERQHVVGQNVEQAGRQFTNRERDRRNAPAFDLGNEDVNNNLVKTRGQLEKDMEKSGTKLVDDEFSKYISDVFKKEDEAAFERGQNAALNVIASSPSNAVFNTTRARNEEMSPEKRLANITKEIEGNIHNLFSSSNVAERINAEATKLGVSPDDYVEHTLVPSLMNKVSSDFDKTELKNLLPSGAIETILMHAQNSMTGALASMGLMTKSQRQYGQRALSETLEGNNPKYNPGLGTRVAGSTLSFMMDMTPIGMAEKPAAAVAGKLFGNGVAQTARIANSTLGGRIARMAGSGMVSQGVTGVLYCSTNAAVQNYSTGDDTSIGNTVKLMIMGGLSEGASWATMGGIGGVVGAGIYNVSGVKRIPAKAFQLAMEGIGMHMGGNVAKTIEGHDTDWTSVEGNLEACANVVALKLTHARLPKRQSKDGVKESYLDMVARNINGLMTSDGQRAAFGGYTFTNEEKEQLFGSASAPKRNESIYGYDAHNNPLTRKESLTSWAMRAKKTAAKGKGEESNKDTDAEFVKTAYDEIMADNTIPWDTKAKFSALVMGTVPSERPMMENCRIEGDSVNEYSKNGELLSKNSFKSIDERNSIIYSLNMKREDQRLSNAYGAAQIKDEKTAQATLEAVAEANGMTAEQLKAAMDKQPLRRSEEEQNACVALRKAYEDEQFVPGTLHAEQSNTEGKDVVEENGLGTETPNNEAASEVLGDLTKAEDALQAAMDGNDVLKEEYERMQKAGMSNPQIYLELFNAGLTQEQLAPLADYINALSKAQGMFKGTQDKIVETTQKHVGQWSYKGELNGEKQNGEQMVFVKDDKGRVLIVGAGDVAFDSEGRVRDGDMLSVYDPATREMDFVHAKDVTLERTASSEEYAKDYQRQLEELNSTVYAEMQSGGEGGQPSLTEPTEPTKPVGEKETTPVGEEPVATLADGTPVPMIKDSKNRETADYSQMSPEQGAEWMSSQFGENAEAAVDGQIKRAEKTLKDAEKIKVDYTGDLNDAKEAEAQKKIAIEAAKAELELYTNIKKAMTEKKVKAGMEKVSSVGGVGSVGEVGNVGVAREKFESGLRVVGNKRTRTLADGTKLKGHYEIVEADSLTPSHNANDGYKKSEGFPVNEEGRTINDRDYENDKQAQLVTDMIAMKYDGQAVDQVPVVTTDGIVVDGNGRTMAGQKAAKDGTDGAYLEALKENAENYGFTAEQIEQSGIKHPRLVLVSDEPMKYDTATFAKFNKNEKKAQGNTQQAVANSKKLSADEIGAIVSEIEGSGSLDAFFNNPSAINSLLTRLVDKGVIGLNEVAGLREGENKLSASGKDFVKNLLLGSVFSENTIRMMGADAMLKTKALNGIRAVTDNMKLGDYALMKEIDQAVQLLYEARQGGSGVDAYLRTPAMFGENAADRFDPISQAIALALEGKAEDFRELMMAYNRNAAPYADASQTEMFGERPTKEDFVNEFLKLRNWEDYETRHSSKEGNGDAGSSEGTEPQARGGSVITSEADYDKAVEQLKKAKGEEHERILDQMGEYVKEFAKSNGYDEPVVLRTKQDLADAAKTENDKTIIENMSEGAHYPGYYEDGKIHIYLEGSTGSEELRETFEHESVHADNDTDPSRVESLVYSITDMNTLTRRDLESVIEKLVHDTHYTDEARKLPEDEALHMLADEALAHLVEYAQKNGIRAISEITNNPTLLNVAEKAFKERENDRRRKEGLAKSGDKTLERKNLDDVSTEENGRALEGDKEGKPENDNGGSHDRDIQAGEEQREVDKAQRTNTTRDPLVETTKATFEQSKAEYLKALKEGKTGKELENAELHYKFSFLDYQNVMGVTDAESLEKLWKREFESAKTSETEPSEASLGLPKPGEQPGEKSEGAKPVGDGKEPKANPLDGMRKAAELFKDEQITKARAELAEAKKSGDASEVKRLTDKLKGLMDSTLRGKGIGLVERRKIIGEELGKAEAEKIDKPWADMEFDEQVAETEKKPLDADEIKNSDCDGVDKANAVAYLNGDKNIINTLSYLTVYDNVRNRERDSVPSSGTEDGTQLDAADNAGGEGLGRTDSRPQGVDSGQLGGSEGDGNPERGESVQSGERVSGGESGKVHATTAVGERGGEQVHGGASRVEPVSTGGTKPRGSRGVRGTGRDVRERGNEESGNFSDEKAGEATGGRGIDSRNLSTVEQIDKEISDTQSLVDDLFNSLFDGRTKGSIISDRTNASIIPLASDHLLGKLGINKQKMVVYKQLIPALTKLGYLHIKKGVVKLNDWIDAMKGSFGGHLTKLGLSDEEVYDYIKNMWNSNIEVDGVTHKLSEWASILGTERMKKEIATPNAEKYKRQVAAEPIKVKVGDIKNIEETLPYLLPQQQEDVLRAETQFFGKEHADREHAYGKGYMFTNGTGTGKTFTGLGVAKRLVKQGKGRILIVTPSQKKVSDWIKDGRNLNMEIRDLDSIAKERGTTATTESGEGVVITTFANFGVNKKLLETKWDAVIYDESHRIMENKNGTETARSMQHYMVTNRSENHCFLRLQETNKDYQKMKSLGERFDAERGKEVKRIQDEYKASHPSATPRDVAYATSRMLPKERNGFTPGDYASFPKLGKIHAEFVKALSHYTNEVEPKLKAQAKNEWKDTKTIFLSATPFNTRENLDYAEGYIFKYPEVEKGGRTQFYLDHFGAAYKFRYNRLEQSTSNPEAVAKQEIAFSDYLQDTLGTMSGRIIDSPYDYSRDFPTVSPDHAETFNQAVQDAVRGHEVLAKAYNQTIGDYNYGSALFETMKVANIIERIKAHLDAGRKVVIFHRRVETKEPLKPPFASMLEQANRLIAMMKPGEEQKKAIKAVSEYRKKYADLLEWEQTLDYSMPREQIAKVFGKDKVLFFSGKESTKVKDKAVDTFNSDDSGKNIIVIQEASGKEGISLHDTTGKHQRVCITLALPQSPITALQIEGRTYRIGNKSNAIFEYPILGLNSEMILFGQKFNNQVSTTENLALGSQARSLRDSFANGILEHSGVVPIDQQGVGGKEFDAPKDQSTDGFDNAVLDYYSNQKLNSRNREGVDYFPTPEPLGYKMMEWADMGEGDTVLEPSAGHGAIARYAPKGNQMVAIEPSQSLFTKLQLKAGGLGRKFQNTIFENYDISNKHDVVVMNPPFGTAGATAIAHLGKAFKHLEEGGRVVALIPRGSTDKKFEKWIEGEKTAVMRAEVALPDIVFKQAGTNVVCRVVVVDKISNKAMRAKAGSVEKWDLGGHYDKIEDFFEDLRDVKMPDRIIDTNAIMMKKSKQTVKDLKELKNVRVDFNEGGINVRVRGDWKDYSIPFDMEGYSAEQKKKFLASTYETFEQQERQTRNETSQAVLAELKKLTCKLADMTEEEMQRYLKNKYEGKGVMYRIEHAAEVYNKAKQHYRMELGNTFSDSKEHFDAVRDRAVEEKGIVMPNLNKEKVKVVEVEKHGFGSKERETLNNAKAWAISNLVTTGKQELPTMRDGTTYTISKKAIDKYLSESAVKKSENLDTHLSVLSKLKDVIHESIEAEIHPDYKKGEDGLRSVENGYGEGVLVHRLYGAVEIGGKMYRVKTTMQEFRGGEENKPHSYEVTKIELLDSPGKRENPDRPPSDAPNNSIDTAKLLQGVEKSYDSGKKLLDESKNLTDGETFFRKESDKSGYASLGLSEPTEPLGEREAAPSVSERIGKAIDKAVEKTGGKVKMVNSVEEIGNEQVRRDIENGKQVTGWYDENTGEVHLYMPNIHDSYTAEKTVWHETVGHKGMRGLLGDKFNDYMRGLWMDLDNPVNAELRAYVKERMGKDSMGFYDAIEEFIAESAEKGKGEPGFWNYIKNKVTDALHEIGYRISPNVKDVKYMLWLAKNVQKKGNDPWWKMRADAVKWKIEHENVEYTKIHGGEFYENDGKNHDFEDMTKEEWDEATDGQIHYRTAPSAATALDRYHKMLDAHGYMATEAFMDNMLSLDKLMRAVDPSIKKIEDVKSSMNPYILQNTMQGAMSDKMTLFEHQVMKPLDKAMSDVLDSFAGKNTEEKIRECNLYMIGKHGLERNRVLFVRDKIREERRVKSEESNSIDALEASWKGERNILGKKLRSGQIDLREYYRQMDEWIVQNIDKDFKAEEHDYSGMHGLQEIDDLKSPYDDAGAIDSVMSQEAKMESLKKGSVDNLWKRIKDATDYSIDSDYENGLMDKTRHDRVKNMFDWYVPLRKYDEATAEDVYGYISGDNGKGFIGETLMNAKGRKSLSDVNVLAQIGAMGNRAIRNGGQNAVKQAFARFVRNSGEQNLVKETKVWVEKKGTDMNGNDIWEEAYPQIPDGADANTIATIVDAFETDMKTKQAKGEAKTLSNSTDIGFKFARAKNKSEHFVDVKIAGRTHSFVVMGNPRAAQALNGMLENSSPNSALLKGLKSTTRFMAQMATSYSPEFVMRNIIRDAEFASSNVTAKEGVMYGFKWARYYAELNPLNVAYNEGAGALKSLKWKDLKEGVGMGLYARYREGTLGNSKMERYFKEFMENGGETGWVQVKTMQEWEKDYKRDVSREHSKVAKTGKALRDFLVGNVKNLNEVAENMARFATFCTSRDLGRSAVRSAYDAKQVSTNFNRHGSGDAIKTFKNGEMGTSKEMRRNVYGTIASNLRNYSMFFNAGVQSTHLLMNNVKKAPVGTIASMMAIPFGLGIMAAVVNNAMIASEDEKKRKGVKDPYGELPEYIRRNNLCIYIGGGEFVTVPLAIELRAFYGLGDIAAGMTAAKNVKSTRNAAMDAVGCMSQLLPVVDFVNSATFDKEPGKELLKGVSPTAFAPFVEWWLNSDWKGTPIRREGDYTKNRPAWMNAYSGTPEKLMDLNKWVNAKTNDVAPGNENMRGNSLLDEATDPAMLNHIIGTLGGGAATFITRGTGLVLKYADGREQEIETKDIPFLRSLMYTPSEQASMARTKAKWYGYKESMEKGTSNYSMLKNKNVPLTERIRNAADRHRFEQSADYARIRIIKDAEKQMKRWNKMKRLNADDKKQVDFANKNIEMIMQKAVEQMDKVSDD
jgi:predicted RNA methylase